MTSTLSFTLVLVPIVSFQTGFHYRLSICKALTKKKLKESAQKETPLTRSRMADERRGIKQEDRGGSEVTGKRIQHPGIGAHRRKRDLKRRNETCGHTEHSYEDVCVLSWVSAVRGNPWSSHGHAESHQTKVYKMDRSINSIQINALVRVNTECWAAPGCPFIPDLSSPFSVTEHYMGNKYMY